MKFIFRKNEVELKKGNYKSNKEIPIDKLFKKIQKEYERSIIGDTMGYGTENFREILKDSIWSYIYFLDITEKPGVHLDLSSIYLLEILDYAFRNKVRDLNLTLLAPMSETRYAYAIFNSYLNNVFGINTNGTITTNNNIYEAGILEQWKRMFMEIKPKIKTHSNIYFIDDAYSESTYDIINRKRHRKGICVININSISDDILDLFSHIEYEFIDNLSISDVYGTDTSLDDIISNIDNRKSNIFIRFLIEDLYNPADVKKYMEHKCIGLYGVKSLLMQHTEYIPQILPSEKERKENVLEFFKEVFKEDKMRTQQFCDII